MVVAAVPWARHDGGHTRAFDDLAAWLVRLTSKSAVGELLRIAWRTVGAIVTRVDRRRGRGGRVTGSPGSAASGSTRSPTSAGHQYLIVVVDHDTGRLLWAAEGRDKKTVAAFFDLLGEDALRRRSSWSRADGADWIADVVGLRCPHAKLCLDPFHVVVLGHRRPRPGPPPGAGTTARRTGQTALRPRTAATAATRCGRTPSNLTDRQRSQAGLDRSRPTNRSTAPTCSKNNSAQVFAPGGPERIDLLDALAGAGPPAATSHPSSTWPAACAATAATEIENRG